MKTSNGPDTPLVLVIDDEQRVLDEVAAILTSANFACRCCTRPDEALASAISTPPNLILCDTNLFGESGPETCDRIRQQPGLGSVPVMYLSTSQMPDVIRRSYGSSSVYSLRKPFSSDVLIRLIDAAIGAPQFAANDAVSV